MNRDAKGRFLPRLNPDEAQARRATRSRLFFARIAEKAALAGRKAEALRLVAWAHRKGAVATLARVAASLASFEPEATIYDAFDLNTKSRLTRLAA